MAGAAARGHRRPHVLSPAPSRSPAPPLQAYRRSGGVAVATPTSAADGTYALTVDTGGAPFEGYLKGVSSGRLDSYLYFPRPLTADTPNATVLIMSQQTVGLLGLAGGFTQQAGKRAWSASRSSTPPAPRWSAPP